MHVDGCMACDVLTGKIRAPGGIIYEDPYWVVDHSVSPVLFPGFLIIKLKRHCEQLTELTADEMAPFAATLRLTCIAPCQPMGCPQVDAISAAPATPQSAPVLEPFLFQLSALGHAQGTFDGRHMVLGLR